MKNKKWILPVILALILTSVVFVWSLFYNWGIPYFTAHFTFGGMVLPFIVFFLFASLVFRLLISAVQTVRAERKRIKEMTPEERETAQQSLLAAQEERQQQKAKQADERMADIQAKIRANNVPVRHVDNVPKCSRCGSTSITANQKGFGIGKAVVGAAIAGPLGLVAGNAGAKKVRVTCLNCGHQWVAGKS